MQYKSARITQSLLLCSTNQLDLPEYDSCEQLHTALMTAMTGAKQFLHY